MHVTSDLGPCESCTNHPATEVFILPPVQPDDAPEPFAVCPYCLTRELTVRIPMPARTRPTTTTYLTRAGRLLLTRLMGRP